MGRFMTGPTQRVKVRLAFAADVSVFEDERAEEPGPVTTEILFVDVVVEVGRSLEGKARDDAARKEAVTYLEGALSDVEGFMRPGML